MQVPKCQRNLSTEDLGLHIGYRADSVQIGVQITTLHKLHGHVEAVLRLESISEGHHKRMLHLFSGTRTQG